MPASANGKNAASACNQVAGVKVAFFLAAVGDGSGYEHFGALLCNQVFVKIDLLSLGIASGVAAGDRDRSHGKFVFPLHFKVFERAVNDGGAQGGKVKVHQRKNGLRFRVAQANVVFQKLGAVFCYHHAKENKAPVVKAFRFKAAQGGLQNFFVKPLHDVRRYVRKRANRSHSACVGSLGAVFQTLVVAGGQEGADGGLSRRGALRGDAYGGQY